MKLAEALLERKSLQERINTLQYRASQNVLVQEGDVPTESALQLLSEANELITQWGDFVRRINHTNNVAQLENGSTISQAIVSRDELDMRIGALQCVVSAGEMNRHRTARAEIKFVMTIDATSQRRDLDALSRARRELDAKIQFLNWNVELSE